MSLKIREDAYSRMNIREMVLAALNAVIWIVASAKIIESGEPELYRAVIITATLSIIYSAMLVKEILRRMKKRKKDRLKKK